MTKMNLVVFSSLKIDHEFFKKYQPIDAIVTYEEGPISVAVIRSYAAESHIDAVCVDSVDKVDASIVESLHELGIKGIISRSSSVENIDMEATFDKGIMVYRCPYFSSAAVAELVVSMVLTLNRKIHQSYRRVANANYSIDGLVGFDLHKKTVGLLGDCKVARRVGHIFKGFGCRVIMFLADGQHGEDPGFEYGSMEDVLGASDVVSLHLPNSPAWRYIIDRKKLSLMKSHAILVNVSRKCLVNPAHLSQALLSNTIGGAALDVDRSLVDLDGGVVECGHFKEHENDYKILQMSKNCLMTFHLGFMTEEALERRCKVTYSSLISICKGEQGNHYVSKEMLH